MWLLKPRRICSLRIAVKCGQRPRRFKSTVVPGIDLAPHRLARTILNGRPADLGLGPKKPVIARIQRHWIPDRSTQKTIKKTFQSPPDGSSGKFSTMLSEQIPRNASIAKRCKFSSDERREFPDPAPWPLRPLFAGYDGSSRRYYRHFSAAWSTPHFIRFNQLLAYCLPIAYRPYLPFSMKTVLYSTSNAISIAFSSKSKWSLW